ncbi:MULTISPECIES: DUF6518 family protein [unclassified Streptomyces]|uniref:DUF6518 family protein n=1 Tax=unclassified Streptomyces TaxID=2593676 RepID=UPI0033EEA852
MFATQRREVAPLSPDRFALKSVAGCLGAGLALGVMTNLAQGRLPGSWNQIANSGAVWSAVAFVAGALLADRGVRVAVAGGLAAEVGLVTGYYGFAEFGRDGMGMLTHVLVWLVMAVVAGPLFGAAGAWWRRGSLNRRIVGGAALAGAIGTEAAHYAFVLHYMPQAWVCAVLMVALPLAMGRGNRERALTLAAAVSLALCAYAVVYQGFLGSVLG